MISDSQTGIQRPTGLRRAEASRSVLLGLITDHYVAKLVAILFAGVLVLLIDREITITLVDGELFDVRIGDLPRGSPAPGQRVIILDKEPSVAIRSFQPNLVRVTIKGQQKLIEHMKSTALVGRVSIKKGWLKEDKDGLLSTTQAIDGASVNFGLSGATVTFEKPIQVDLDPEWTREVPLAGAPKDVAPGLVADVTFEPAAIKVVGPSYYLPGGAGSITRITIPIAAAGRTGEFTVPVTTLPDEVVEKQIRMAPGQQVTATVRFSKADQKPIDVKDVAISFGTTPKLQREYEFAPIGLAREGVTVTVSGTAEALAAWAGKTEELKKAIKVQIDVAKVVGKVAAQLTQPGARADESGEVEVLRIPDNLKLVGVTPAQVDMTITKR